MNFWKKKPPAVFDHQVAKHELVEYLNNQAAQLKGWRSTEASVKATGMPVAARAMFVTQEPKNFRLVVTNPITGQHSLDLGSNPKQFWTWTDQMKINKTLTVKHENIRAIQPQLPFPVDPEWLMEVLGLKQFDASKIKLVHAAPKIPEARLVSEYKTKEGVVVRKVAIVDLHQGVIKEHRLYDAKGNLISAAKLSQFREAPIQGLKMAHRYRFDWNKPKVGITLTLDAIEVNPENLDASLWKIPVRAGFPVYAVDHQLIKIAERNKRQELARSQTTKQEYVLNPLTKNWDARPTVAPSGFIPSPTASSTASPFSVDHKSASLTPSPWDTPPVDSNDAPPFRSTVSGATKHVTGMTTLASNPGWNFEKPTEAPSAFTQEPAQPSTKSPSSIPEWARETKTQKPAVKNAIVPNKQTSQVAPQSNSPQWNSPQWDSKKWDSKPVSSSNFVPSSSQSVPPIEQPIMLISEGRAEKLREENKTNRLGNDPWNQKTEEPKKTGRVRLKAITAGFKKRFSRKKPGSNFEE